MKTTELKNQIINKINLISNQDVLEEIYKIVTFQKEIDDIYKLSIEEKKAVENGLIDIENGDVYTTEDANKLLREWLKK